MELSASIQPRWITELLKLNLKVIYFTVIDLTLKSYK